MRSVGDVVLEWMSELGAGRWSNVRESIGSLRNSYPDLKRPAWQIADALDASGHLDLDWDADRWSVAPPALCLLPSTSLCASWVGARPRAHQRRLATELAGDLGVFDFQVRQNHHPSALFIKASAVADLEACAAGLGLAFIIDPASQIAQHLPAVSHEPGHAAAAPTPHESVRRFSSKDLSWSSAEPPYLPGLYDIDRRGQKVARWRDDRGEWREIDRVGGLMRAVVGANHQDLIRWRPRSSDARSPSWLELRWPLMLPKLAQRAAVASSGLLPIREGSWLRYRNVSWATAAAIATSLGAKLKVPSAQEAPRR